MLQETVGAKKIPPRVYFKAYELVLTLRKLNHAIMSVLLDKSIQHLTLGPSKLPFKILDFFPLILCWTLLWAWPVWESDPMLPPVLPTIQVSSCELCSAFYFCSDSFCVLLWSFQIEISNGTLWYGTPPPSLSGLVKWSHAASRGTYYSSESLWAMQCLFSLLGLILCVAVVVSDRNRAKYAVTPHTPFFSLSCRVEWSHAASRVTYYSSESLWAIQCLLFLLGLILRVTVVVADRNLLWYTMVRYTSPQPFLRGIVVPCCLPWYLLFKWVPVRYTMRRFPNKCEQCGVGLCFADGSGKESCWQKWHTPRGGF